jgi:DNA (cytosine-5)-methyltransferase 1
MSVGPVLGSLCTGYGGLDLGVLAALGGGRIAWCADPDPHVQQILAARMPDVPNLGDLRAINWAAVEPVDVLVAGFPCQDISAAGRRVGIEKGERSGLWTDIVAGIRVLRPALLIVENVAALRWRNGGLHRVLGDLAEAGYDALWRSVRASDIGAPHRRERVFLLAWPRAPYTADAADTASARRRQPRRRRSSPPTSAWTPGQLARCGDRCGEAAAHADRDQPERRRGPQPLARPTREASSTRDQRQRDGHAVVHRGEATSDPDRVGREGLHTLHPRRRTVPVRSVLSAGHDQVDVPADTSSNRRNERLSCTARFQRRPDAALCDHPAVSHNDATRTT